MWKPRLVALDVDGTLVDSSNLVSGEVREAVGALTDAGVPVILATGRSWHSAAPIVGQLPLQRTEHVCSNGAVTVRFPPFEVVDLVTFDPAPVIGRILREHPSALLAVEVVGQGYRVTDHFPIGELHGTIEVTDADDLAAHDVTRIIVRDPNASEREFVTLAHRLGLEGVSYAIGFTAWLDIAPHGIDKGHGLARVCTRLGIDPADVLAMGDGRNDIEMLTFAGRGVAMGDAPAEVREAADAVTGRFAEGGHLAELRRWI